MQVSSASRPGVMRFRGADVKKRIDAGRIGDIVVLHQTSRWSIAEDWYKSGTPGWFADPAQVPGGAFIDEGIYWIDYFRWLSSSEVVQVEAKVANSCTKTSRWKTGEWPRSRSPTASSPHSKPRGRSTLHGRAARRRNRTASYDWRSWDPRRNHRSVVSHAWTLSARRRRRRLGLRTAIGRILHPGVTVPARSPHRVPGEEDANAGHDSRCADVVRCGNGRLRISPEGEGDSV